MSNEQICVVREGHEDTDNGEQSVVGINPWAAHFNQDVFGPDAKEFRPDRWLEEGSKKSMDGYLLSVGLSDSIIFHLSHTYLLKLTWMDVV